MNQRTTLLAGAILGGLGVALGAFGAHALKAMLTQTGRLDTFELAVRYEFYHAFALLVAGIAQQFIHSKFLRTAAPFFLAGTILFSGSLYLLCFTNNTSFAMATPFGGVLLIVGWLFLAVGIYNKK
ncbi:MAG TPA: DUF423 domain-containing protein [Cyclobacteriaceae bacterium]|nr:DUF423 domain-containing protein [Cyclobacteriaceae bacterium]